MRRLNDVSHGVASRHTTARRVFVCESVVWLGVSDQLTVGTAHTFDNTKHAPDAHSHTHTHWLTGEKVSAESFSLSFTPLSHAHH